MGKKVKKDEKPPPDDVVRRSVDVHVFNGQCNCTQSIYMVYYVHYTMDICLDGLCVSLMIKQLLLR